MGTVEAWQTTNGNPGDFTDSLIATHNSVLVEGCCTPNETNVILGIPFLNDAMTSNTWSYLTQHWRQTLGLDTQGSRMSRTG